MNEKKKEKPLKDYEVTLYPSPVKIVVTAQAPWQAVDIAEDRYASGKVWEYGFDNYNIKPITPEESREKYLESLKK